MLKAYAGSEEKQPEPLQDVIKSLSDDSVTYAALLEALTKIDLNSCKGDLEQIDDVCVMGIRI